MDLLVLVITVLIGLGIAAIPAYIADEKGRNFWRWYIYAVFLFPIAFFHSLSLTKEDGNENVKFVTPPQTNEDIRLVSSKEYEQIPEKKDVNAIVSVINYEIAIREGNLILKILLKSIAERTIQALKIDIRGFNAFQEAIEVDGKFTKEILVQDLNLQKDGNCTAEVELKNELKDARTFDFYVSQVCYFDGKIENCLPQKMVTTCQEKLPDEYLDFAKSISVCANYYMIDYKDYWQCSCGNICISDDKCDYCKMNKETARVFAYENIEDRYKQFLKRKEEEHNRRREEEQIQENIRIKEQERLANQKMKRRQAEKWGLLCVLSCLVAFGGIIIYSEIYIPHNEYKQAPTPHNEYNQTPTYESKKSHVETRASFLSLDGYKDSDKNTIEYYYQQGMYEYENENYEKAIEHFRKIIEECESIQDVEYNQTNIKNTSNQIKYLEIKKDMSERAFIYAWMKFKELPDDFDAPEIIEDKRKCAMEVAQTYLKSEKYEDCMSVLEGVDLTDNDIYREAMEKNMQ